jgi:hypothetical protein
VLVSIFLHECFGEESRLNVSGARITSLGTRPLLFDHGIRIYNVARIDKSTRGTGVSRSLFFLSVMIDREGPWTYSEGVKRSKRTAKVLGSHAAFNLLSLLNGHILPGLRVLDETIFHLDCIDAGKSELALKVLEWTTKSDGQNGSLNGMLDSEIFERREDRISSLG